MAVDLIGDQESPYALIRVNRRSIGTIIPDVTVEEVHHDELVITEHPVEVGAAIADHAFKRPAEVEMRIGFSDSSHQSVGFVQQAYAALLDLQAQREPFNVSTGKRQYSNMLIRGLAVTTDEKTEFALSVVVSLKQVIITPLGQNNGADPAAQTFPQQTSGVLDIGQQQLQPSSAGTAAGLPLFASGSLQQIPFGG